MIFETTHELIANRNDGDQLSTCQIVLSEDMRDFQKSDLKYQLGTMLKSALKS